MKLSEQGLAGRHHRASRLGETPKSVSIAIAGIDDQAFSLQTLAEILALKAIWDRSVNRTLQ